MQQAKPILKWAGGKVRSASAIVAELPASIGTYREPCFGAGAVFFTLANESPRRYRAAVLSDVNRELVECYQVVRDDVAGVIDELHSMRLTEKYYYRLRRERPKTKQRRAARVIYLNKLAYNGLYRVDKAGRFNVPFGDQPNANTCNIEVLMAASAALADVEILCSDFAIAWGARPGDAIYLDPPYIPISPTAKFVGYDAGGFDEAAQVRLARMVRELANDGVAVVASNADCPLALELYAGHKIQRLSMSRSINGKGDGRGKVSELLITAVSEHQQKTAVAAATAESATA